MPTREVEVKIESLSPPELTAPDQVVVTPLRSGSTVRLLVGGEVDFASAHVLERSIHREEMSGPAEVIIDLAQTAFLDAGGLKVLARAARRAGRGAWKLRVENTRGMVRRVFDITDMEAVIQHWQSTKPVATE